MTHPSITDPNYKEREEVEFLDEISRYHGRFKGIGWAIPKEQYQMYHALKDELQRMTMNHPQYPKFIWKPRVADVGMGLGWGSNILSQEADFVWGIDKNKENVRWAKQAFERIKNNVYYSAQLTFDVMDIYNEPRELMTFDVVTCIEVIEHLAEPEKLMTFLKRLCKKDRKGCYPEPPNSTIVWISTPNRNSDRIQKDTPKNEHHCREWSAEEFYAFLIKYYKYVVLYDNFLKTPLELNTKVHPMIAKCELPL